MKPSDIGSLISLSTPAVAPDGSTIAVVVNRVDEEQNRNRSQVWVVVTDGSARPRPFTSGDDQDANPTWSPDGSLLAFTCTRGDPDAGRETTVRVAPFLGGGEVVTIARLDEPVADLRWSPDGQHLAFTSRTRIEGYDDDPRRQPPRRITRLGSRLDNVGHTVDRPQHVYVVRADGSAAPRNLTPGVLQFANPAWTPDSAGLVVSGATHDSWDLEPQVDLHHIALADGTLTTLTRQTGSYSLPAVAPDGGLVAFVGTDHPESFPRNQHVAVRNLEVDEQVWVTAAKDRTFAPYPGAQAPHWLDNRTLLVAAEDRGDVHLYRVAADGVGEPEAVWSGRGVVTGYHEAAGTVAVTLTTADQPAELYVLDGDGPRRLTHLTTTFVARTTLREPQQFTVLTRDASVDLDAWLLTPPDFDPARAYPLLLNIHGGPFTQYGNGFFDEVQMQAAAGYVVLWCNPRGSSGREEAFGRAIVGPSLGGTGWGSVDFDDVMAVLDHVLDAYPFVDADRLGVLGGSYGGYLTSWAVGHTDRFAAAVSERAVNNVASLEWGSDVAGAFRRTLGVSHLDDPELYQRLSPISHVRHIRTPLLILHSEQDLRCPVEQADQLFVALRLLEREVELVRFPAESHELSRSGSPVHRRQRAEIILEFFGRHLKPDA